MRSFVNLYIAGAFGERELCERWARTLRAAGRIVVSTWHHPGPRTDEFLLTEAERLSLLRKNDEQIARADIVLALTFAGTPRSTFCEVGSAITRGKPVIVVHRGDVGRFLWDSHPKAVRVDLGDGPDTPPAAITLAIEEALVR